MSGNIFSFYLHFFFLDKSWMNWVMFASVTACVPIFFVYTQKLGRYDVDVGVDTPNVKSVNTDS